MALAMTAGTDSYGYRKIILSHMAPSGADRVLAILPVGVSDVIFAALAGLRPAPMRPIFPVCRPALSDGDMITAARLREVLDAA